MAVKTLYFKNATGAGAPTNSLSLQDGGTAPATGITTTGWTVAKLATPNTSAMLGNTKRASNTFQSGDSIPSFSGGTSSFRSENLFSGTFANTNWSFAFRLRAVSAASSQTGQIKIRVYKSQAADGTTGLVQISSVVVAGTTTAALSTTVSATSTVTWTPGATMNFANEYLWVQCEWSIIGTSGSNNADAVFYIESAGAITTPDFAANVTNTEPAITAGSVPIVGASITPVYEVHSYVEPAITAGAVPIVGASITPIYAGATTETEVFAVTLNNNDSGDGSYTTRSIFPVVSMSDAAFLVLIADFGTTSSARYISGLSAIDGTPGVGAFSSLQGSVDSYNRAYELGSSVSGVIYNVNSVKIKGTGASRQICARLEASTAAASNFDNVSIGIWNGTNSTASPYAGSTTATPVELKWSGASGVSISAGAMSAYSDWMPFPEPHIKGVYGAYTLNSANGGWAGTTLVCVISAADTKVASGDQVRIATYYAAPNAGDTTSGYIAQQAASGDPFDFKASPTPSPITWGGNATLTHDGVTSFYLSDPVTLPEAYDETKTYCAAFQFAGANVGIRYNGGVTNNGLSYYKGGLDAATPDKSGYTSFIPGNPCFIEMLEVLPSAATGINYTEPAITAGSVPIVGASIADVFAITETVAPSSLPIIGAATVDVYARSETVTAGALPIVGSIIVPALSKKYSDTVVAGALPIAGSTILPIFSAGGINYTEPAITAGAVPLVGLALADVFARKATLAAGALPITGQPITPIFAIGAPTGKTWVNVGGVWKQTTTYVKVGGVWTHPVASFVKDGGVWKAIQ